jgi:hypothetical protein
MLWAVIDITADWSPDTVFLTDFGVLFMHSTFPEGSRPQEIQVFPKPLAISCTTSATKTGPLSDPIDTGIPNRGMISFNRHQATSRAFSVHVGKASTHPEEVQTNTNRYLHPRTLGISVKSTSSFQVVPPTLCTWGGALSPCLGLFLAHRLYLSHTALLMLKSLGT